LKGVSISPGTVRGTWIDAGVRYEDELVRISVDVPDTAKNRQFFASFKAKLIKRFGQLEIYIASYAVDII
jgi:hypothetical protein